MLDLKFVVENLDEVKAALKARGDQMDLSSIGDLASQRRDLIARFESLRREQNLASEEMRTLPKGSPQFRSKITEMQEVAAQVKASEADLKQVEDTLQAQLLLIPNMPAKDVPLGESSADNLEVRRVGEPVSPVPNPQTHWDIGEGLSILDFKRASKITGARFTVLYDDAARLERALISFMLDVHTQEHGYQEVLPPFMVNRDSMIGTGQLPKFEDDAFKAGDYYLIPTAEVPVTNIHRDEVLSAEDLTRRYVAYTPCFRKEAGSYGKDTRGLIRQHQFNKVELVAFTTPEESEAVHEELTGHAETILKKLELPYRVVSLCTGDLGFAASKCYDLEAWLPGQNAYREISSCSNFKDFQARRANIRYRPEPGARPRYVHTLNGSGLAVGRTLVAILENYQDQDGSVHIPAVLQPYMNGRTKITAPKTK